MYIEKNTIYNFDESVISTENKYKEKNINLTIIIQLTSLSRSLARSIISRLSNSFFEILSSSFIKTRERVRDVIKVIYIDNTKRRNKLIVYRN